MNKLVQTIVLTTLVFSPLSFLNLVSSATAHHTPSHVSTVSAAGNTKQKLRNKKVKKVATLNTKTSR